MNANTSHTETGVIEVKVDPKKIVQEYQDKAELSYLNAEGVVISNNEDYVFVGNSVKQDKQDLKAIEAERKKITVPLNAALDAVNLLFKRPKDRLQEAIDLKGRGMLAWEETLAREKTRLEKEARERQEAEAKKAEAEAKKAEKSGDKDKADTLRRQAEESRAITPQVNNEPPKIGGLTPRETYWAEIVDLKVLIKHCLETGNPYVVGDQKTLDSLARTTKGKAVVPGVVFKSEKKIAGARE